MVTVSIVSHGHGSMVARLVESLLLFSEVSEVIVTRNIPEAIELPDEDRVIIVDNPVAKGFGANHNAAFRRCHSRFFCPLNPDVLLRSNPFPPLLRALQTDALIGMVAPIVLAPSGKAEDSARFFPTFAGIVRKVLFGDEGRYRCLSQEHVSYVDWVAGMFMFYPSSVFQRVKGFDERFFMYYEDVDICARLQSQGVKVAICHDASVVHDARRDSHRSFRHLRWHISSMLRYFWKRHVSFSSYARSPSPPSRSMR